MEAPDIMGGEVTSALTSVGFIPDEGSATLNQPHYGIKFFASCLFAILV